MRASAFAVVSIVLTLSSLPALAQTEAAKAQALKRYQEGMALHDKGKEEEAYLQFIEAYAVVQTPPILFNLARTEQLTGRHVAAAEHFRAYLAIPEHPRVTPALRAKAQAFLTELQPVLGHIAVEAPAGAVVTVDGKAFTGGAGGALDVEPGAHTIAARVGEKEVFKNVTVVAGATTPVRLEIAAPPPPVVSGVVVDPPMKGPAVVLPPPVEPAREAWWTTRRKVGVVITGIGVVGLVAGLSFGLERGSDTSTAMTAQGMLTGNTACFHAGPAACATLANALNSNTSAAGVESAFLIGGAVLVVAGAVTTLWPSASTATTTGVVPSVGPHGGGMQWMGSF